MWNWTRVVAAVALVVAGCSGPGPESEKTCADNNGGCDPNADCSMVSGFPACKCKTGFSGDGVTCTDSAGPVLVLTSPAADAVFSAAAPATVEVSGTVTDTALAGVTLSLDGAAAQTVEVANGAFRVTLPLADEDSVKHTVVVVAKDASKNEATATRTFTVDRVGPVLAITSPAADATCADSCTGAVVNLASGATFEFTGTASDRGEVVADSLVATLDDAPVELTKGATWSFKWATIPEEKGAFHTFKLVAADKAGNQSEVTRKVYVDRVAPCAKNLVAGARLVKRTSALVEFTEAMDPTSTATALVLSPAVAASAVLDSSGKKLGFAKDEDLVAYQVYEMDLKATAKDRAGNPVGDAAACKMTAGKLLTAPVLPAGLPGMADSASTLLVDVDSDGLPHVVVHFWESSWDQGDMKVAVWSWDGRSSFQKTAFDFWVDGQHGTRWYVPVDLRVVAAEPQDLLLRRVGHVAGFYGADSNARHGGDPIWRLDYQPMPGVTTKGEVASLTYSVSNPAWLPRNERAIGGLLRSLGAEPSVSVLAIDPNDAKRVLKKAPSVQWTTAVEWFKSSTTIRGFLGTALINDQVVYLPTKTTLSFGVSDPAASLSVFGLEQRSARDSAGSWKDIGAAWIAWAEQQKPAGLDYGALYLACASEPTSAASWKRSLDLSPIPAADRNSGLKITEIRMASSDATVAIAVKISDAGGSVYSATLPNECTLPTTLTWSTPVKNVTTAIAVGPDGTVWKAVP